MEITGLSLKTLGTGFSAAFQAGLDGAAPTWSQIATEVPSTTSQNEYAWLRELPGLREWLGDRVLHQAAGSSYTLKNRHWEDSIGVKRTDLEDDNLGVYRPLFQALGEAAARFPDELVWGLLARGHLEPCWDGLPFFSAAHPNGTGTVSNVTAPPQGQTASAPWFLLDTSRFLKPLIYQTRQAPRLVAKTDALQSDLVFMTDRYFWGVDLRANAGFGLWQLAHRSTDTLDRDGFDAAYDAMTSLRSETGRPMGIRPTLLVVPPALRTRAAETVTVSRLANGADNPNQGLVQVLVSPWLAG